MQKSDVKQILQDITNEIYRMEIEHAGLLQDKAILQDRLNRAIEGSRRARPAWILLGFTAGAAAMFALMAWLG